MRRGGPPGPRPWRCRRCGWRRCTRPWPWRRPAGPAARRRPTRARAAVTGSGPPATRGAIGGIVHRPDAQLIMVDTPGLHRPRTLLGERLDSLVRSTLVEVDVIGFCLPAAERIGPGDKYLAAELAGLGTPVVAVVTKTDQASRPQVAAQLAAVAP